MLCFGIKWNWNGVRTGVITARAHCYSLSMAQRRGWIRVGICPYLFVKISPRWFGELRVNEILSSSIFTKEMECWILAMRAEKSCGRDSRMSWYC